MRLYDRDWNRRELEARTGRIEQIGGLRRVILDDGNETGVEEIQVRTGAGLAYSLLPSRGLDIGLTEFGGVPLSWQSPNGAVHPAYFDDRAAGWLRTAAGGLLMTCGLSQAGWPGAGDEDLGLHGRAHHTPARQVSAEGHWEGDEYLMSVQGNIEETSIFGLNLELSRQIRSRLGRNEILIRDVIRNAGFEPAPHMLLYHFNFGFPLLGEETEIALPAARVTARDPGVPVEDLGAWLAPQASYRERVYYHEDLAAGADGIARAAVRSPHFPPSSDPLTVHLAWDAASLPVLVQWKMPGQGTHVLGLEPANCHVEGRSSEGKRGTLVMLAPGETREYNLELVLDQA
jgi:hypothetical protein